MGPSTSEAVPSKDDDVAQGITPTAGYKLIYAYSDTHQDHAGWLKVGDATLHSSKSWDKITDDELRQAARKRINEYTRTADIATKIELVRLAVRPVRDQSGVLLSEMTSFRDYEVHKVLERSGWKRVSTLSDKVGGEWFKITPEEVEAAIDAVVDYKHYINSSDAAPPAKITLRAEQEQAVKDSLSTFNKASLEDPRRMLWNAKMRFGKTLTTYELVKRLSKKDPDSMTRVLIITHRPDVNDSWKEDFRKMGMSDEGWTYGAKRENLTFEDVSSAEKFVWFASIQDLRGSVEESSSSRILADGSAVSGEVWDLVKNEEIFGTDWDLVVTDEAHEGTLTELAKLMFSNLKSSRYLDLSGTPFNIINAESWDDAELAERFSYHGTYHWSYPDERRAKKAWQEKYGDDPNYPNPYDSLPEVKFVTYDVSDSITALRKDGLSDKYGGISFSELFRTELGEDHYEFVHEDQVVALLRKMLGDDVYSEDASLFPFHKNFENYFKHTLWMLPNVAACNAMERLLKEHHSGFSGWEVVNATGEASNSWGGKKTALAAVQAVTKGKRNSITLSQQMLTTGVTVTPWTAVFMLNNTTSPMLYMQTAFRAASPGTLPDGRVKETAYVFDFNPDRCLREIVEVAKVEATDTGVTDPTELAKLERETVDEYLKYLSVLTLTGSKFVKPDSEKIMEQLNEAYINEVIEKGFDSPRLWNNKELVAFDIQKVKILEQLRKLQGGREGDKRKGVLPVTHLSSEERAIVEELKTMAKEEGLSETDRAYQKELEAKESTAVKQERKNRQNAVSILAGVAARLPMLVYAAPADVKIEPGNFAKNVDEESWREFMPKNLIRVMPEGTKPLEERQEDALAGEGNVLYWEDIRRFFDSHIFTLACERIRRIARELDEKPPLERAFRTAALFSNFKNPDKETVLTPFRVVSIQYGHTLGGLQFLDLEKSTAEVSMALTRNLESGELESHGVRETLSLLDSGSHELAPVWKEGVSEGLEEFWESDETTIFDINSKTALYPLFGAASLYYKNLEGLTPKQRRFFNERECWNSIIESQVFVNCRVPYSARIARRVLAGYNEDVAVNASVIDVIEVRRKLKEARVPKSEGKKGVRPLSSEEEALVWRSIFNPEAIRSGSGEKLAEKILSIGESEDSA